MTSNIELHGFHSPGIVKSKAEVLHLIGSFDQGGSERQALQLVGLLSECGSYCVHLAVMNPQGVLRRDAEVLGLGKVPEYPLTSFHDGNFLVQLKRCAAHLRDLNVSVVHTHDFYSNVFGMAAATLAKVPVRIASRRETGGMRTVAQKWVERRAYNLAHAVVANSQAVGQRLISEGVPDAKIVTIYNGLDIKRVMPCPGLCSREALAELNLPDDGRRFVTMVANLRHTVKDHATFLRAAKLVCDQVSEAGFVLAGEGELLVPMRAFAAQLGLEERIFFLGRCHKIAELLAMSDVCVLTSRFEGFSNAILEYMGAARPVVATDVGGAREAIREGETGYLVAAGDEKSMAARIITLLRDPNRARSMGERGRKVVEQKFSTQALLECTQQLYRRLLQALSR